MEIINIQMKPKYIWVHSYNGIDHYLVIGKRLFKKWMEDNNMLDFTFEAVSYEQCDILQEHYSMTFEDWYNEAEYPEIEIEQYIKSTIPCLA